MLRWTSLAIDKSLEVVNLIIPRSSLREDETFIAISDHSRARYFIDRLKMLRSSLVGVVLPPLLVSLFHFAKRPKVVESLPALLGLLWELDGMNKFFIASKSAFEAVYEADQAEKWKHRQEAAALAAAEIAAAAYVPSSKDRKARYVYLEV